MLCVNILSFIHRPTTSILAYPLTLPLVRLAGQGIVEVHGNLRVDVLLGTVRVHLWRISTFAQEGAQSGKSSLTSRTFPMDRKYSMIGFVDCS